MKRYKVHRMTSSLVGEWNAFRCYSGRIVHNYRTLFNFRLCWLCTIMKLLETMDNQINYDWRRLQKLILIKWWELETSGFGPKLWKEDQSCSFRHDTIATDKWQRSETRRTIVFFLHQIRRQRLTVKKATKIENLTREVRCLPIQKI